MNTFEAQKIIVSSSECLPGMILLQPILDEKTGTVLLPKGQVLTEENIHKIHHFKHTQVWVGINNEDNRWKLSEEDLRVYEDYTKLLQDIVGKGTTLENIDIKRLKALASRIVRGLDQKLDLLTCVNLVREMEIDNYRHSINVAFLSLLLGKWRGDDEEKLEKIVEAALLHDVGKDELSETAYHDKTHKVDLREKLAYKRHPIYGYEKLVKYNELDNEVLKAILSHHERCDGSGFPLSLKEDKISDIAKVVALAEAYEEARMKKPIFEVIKELRTSLIRGFEADLVLALCNNIMNYYIGAYVLLNTGKIGEIYSITRQAVYRPILRVEGKYIDLFAHNELEIVKVF